MMDLPRQTRNHSIDEPEPLPDLSAMPDPRGLQAGSLQADTSLHHLLAPGRDMLVDEPQPLPGVLPPSDAQKSADDFTEFYRSLPFGLRAGIAEQGGLPSLATHFMQQRQSAAAKMMELQAEQKKAQMGDAFKVFLDHNTPWSARAKALEQQRTPYASSLARVGSEQIASNFALAHPYLDDAFKQQWEKDPTSIPPAVVEAHLKQAMQRGEKDQQFQLENKRLEDIQTRVQNNQPVTLHEAGLLEKHLTEQAELPVKLQMLREQLGKAKADTQASQNKPTQAYEFRTPEGGIGTAIYDPRTGTTNERVGMPLQRVQTQDMTAATKTKNAEILDNGENVLGIINQYRSVLRPENVGLVGDLRGLVFGAGQQSDAFAQLLKGQANAVVDQLGQSGGTVNVSNFFDPKLSKSELLGNILTYQLAFINSPDGRVSNDDFKVAKQSLSIDKLLTGSGDISSKVDALEEVVHRRMAIASRRLGTEQAKPPKFKNIDEYKKARGIK